MSGRLERDPNPSLLAATGGGALALLANRLDLAHAPRHWRPAGAPPGARPGGPAAPVSTAPTLPRPPSTYFDQIYVDTASHSSHALRANLAVFGNDHVLFGTDTPPLPHELDDLVKQVHDAALDNETAAAVLTRNAVKLFHLSDRHPATV